jgi:hypothetical protein
MDRHFVFRPTGNARQDGYCVAQLRHLVPSTLSAIFDGKLDPEIADQNPN